MVCIVYEQRPGGAPGEDGGGISIDAIVSYHRRAAASRGFGFGVFLRVRCSLILFLSSIQSFRLGSVRAAEGGEAVPRLVVLFSLLGRSIITDAWCMYFSFFLFLVAVIMACEEHCGREFSTLKFIPVYCESLARVPHVLCAAKLVASHEFQIFLSVLSPNCTPVHRDRSRGLKYWVHRTWVPERVSTLLSFLFFLHNYCST